MEKKLIVCDLDGTLLNDQKEVTKRTADTLKKAKAAGCKICFASGRGEQMMSVYADAIGGCDYMVSCNGAMARCFPEEETIYVTPLKDKDAYRALEYIFEHQLNFMMYTIDQIYYSGFGMNLRNRVVSYEKKAASLGFPVVLPAYELGVEWKQQRLDDIVKIVVYEEDEKIMAKYVEFVEHNLSDSGCETTGYGLMGTFSNQVSKQYAVEKIKSHMGITEKDVYVFGDYDNDMSMFACADNRIAMENATDELKKRASAVTKTNNEDGVAVYIEREILNDL